MPSSIAHLTLNTGHLRTSPRAEVSAAAIRALDPIVKAGAGPVPGLDGMRLSIARRAPGRAIITITIGGQNVIAGALVWDADAQEQAWESLRGLMAAQSAVTREPLPPPSMPSSLPWLAVALAPPAAALPADTLMALGDLERCIAWTILAQEGLAS